VTRKTKKENERKGREEIDTGWEGERDEERDNKRGGVERGSGRTDGRAEKK